MEIEFLNFDSLADIYDETCPIDPHRFDAALDYLVSRFSPQLYPQVFEPGIGTGRIAIPLAERGYQVTGIDISSKMLRTLESRLEQRGMLDSITFRQSDILDLPFRENTFDMAVIAGFFYHIRQWRKAVDEVLRVLQPNSPIVLINTGNGNEVPFLQTKYKEICSSLDFDLKMIGVEHNSEVAGYLEEHGFQTERMDNPDWEWSDHIALSKALSYMWSRSYSLTLIAPDEIHWKAMKMLESEILQLYGSLDTRVEIPNEIHFYIASR